MKRIRHETAIQAAETRIKDKLPWLVDQLLALAEGVEVQKQDGRGRTRIYSEPPDREAIKYLMDRVMGKPVQPVSLVDKVRELAVAGGLTDDEVAEAVAEAERVMTGPSRARS